MSRCDHRGDDDNTSFHGASDTTRSIVCMLVRCSAAWEHGLRWQDGKPPPPQIGCPPLQHLILEKFDQDAAFKLECCVKHAERHNADHTLDLLRLAEQWTER